mgnify:CR=1 FL=1
MLLAAHVGGGAQLEMGSPSAGGRRPHEQLWGRVSQDIIGVVLHLVTLLLVLVYPASLRETFFARKPAAPVLLIGQEIVALVAHIIYLYLWYVPRPPKIAPGGRNAYKWAEYSISATFGTIAALLLEGNNYPEWYWLSFLAVTCATQQFIGYQIDLPGDTPPANQDWVQFGIAATLQVGVPCHAGPLITARGCRRDNGASGGDAPAAGASAAGLGR